MVTENTSSELRNFEGGGHKGHGGDLLRIEEAAVMDEGMQGK